MREAIPEEVEAGAPVGQAVVTDPGGGRSSGYVLVAASPSVSAEDARHLTVSPQVTDFLHTAPNPGTFFSFYPLPSGAWAVVKRFIEGRRRGTYNRVVVYTWVVPPAVLAAVGSEPWLLLTDCTFHPPGRPDAVCKPAELGAVAAQEELDALPDLCCQPPAASRQASFALLRRRREVLLKRLSEDELEARLVAIYGALAAQQRVLLPGEQEDQQLLLLAWSALPLADRLATPWTTHLAPSAGSLFRFANVPDPRAVRGSLAGEGWVLASEAEARATEDRGGGVTALARAVARGRLPEEGVYADLRQYGVSLSKGSAALRRRLILLERGGAPAVAGYESLHDLKDAFEELRLLPEEEQGDAWLAPPRLLAAVCATLLRRRGEGEPSASALKAARTILIETGWASTLLAPAVITALVRPAGGEEPATPATLAVAVALALQTVPPADVREELLVLLRHAGAERPGAVPAALQGSLLAELAVGLAREGSSLAAAAFAALAAVPGGFSRARGRLEPKAEDEPAITALLGALRAGGERAEAARLAADLLVPRLLAQPASLLSTLPAADRAFALSALQAEPAALAVLLREGSEAIFDAAIEELKRWAAAESSAAEAVVAELVEEAPEAPLRPRSTIAGLAEALAAMGVAPRLWLPITLVEAEVAQGETTAFAWLAQATPPGASSAAACADLLLGGLRRAASSRRLGEGHRLLLRYGRGCLGARREETKAVLTDLGPLGDEGHLRWGLTLAEVVAGLEERGAHVEASAIACAWWQGLAMRHWRRIPPQTLHLLDALRGDDRRAIAEQWLHPAARLRGQPGEDALHSRLLALADDHPELRFRYGVAAAAAAVRREEIPLIEAACQVENLARQHTSWQPWLERGLRQLLPRPPAEQAAAVVTLLVEPDLRPAAKQVVEKTFLKPSLQAAGHEVAELLPPVRSLARRGSVLLTVARRLGELWQDDIQGVERFLRDATLAGRYDAVAACLKSAEGKGASLLYDLSLSGDRSLVQRIAAASRARRYKPVLRPFARQLQRCERTMMGGRP